jgi:hypothetical protein
MTPIAAAAKSAATGTAPWAAMPWEELVPLPDDPPEEPPLSEQLLLTLSAFTMGELLIPVEFLHISLDSSLTEELKVMSAHCREM